MKPLVQCDCLNECGDDPWLKTERAFYCKRYQELYPTREALKVAAKYSVAKQMEARRLRG